MAVVRHHAYALLGVELGQLLRVIGAFDRLLEGFDRDRWVFPLHVVAECPLLGRVPGALAVIGDDPVLGVQFAEVIGQALRDDHVCRVKPVGFVLPPGEEEKLPVQ